MKGRSEAGFWEVYAGWARLVVAIPGLAAACSGPAHGQSTNDLRGRLHEAAASNALDVDGVKPWHMKLAVQLLDAKGIATEQGTFEEWWSRPDRYRLVYDLPDYKATELHNDAGYFRTKSTGEPPAHVLELIHAIVHPMPSDAEIDKATPDLRRHSFGTAALDCIMLDQPLKSAPRTEPYPPLGLFPTYCFDPGKPGLRLSVQYGTQVTLRNKGGLFQNKEVALDLVLNELNVPSARVQMTALTTSSDVETHLVADGDLAPQANESAVPVASDVQAVSILRKVTPRYPESAKQNHIAGTVVLHAIIGRDGHVQQLRIVSAPSSDLAIASIAAVRQWTYKPYLLNGEPTEVDTTITVNFTFGPG